MTTCGINAGAGSVIECDSVNECRISCDGPCHLTCSNVNSCDLTCPPGAELNTSCPTPVSGGTEKVCGSC
jgi:hypothetical protein